LVSNGNSNGASSERQWQLVGQEKREKIERGKFGSQGAHQLTHQFKKSSANAGPFVLFCPIGREKGSYFGSKSNFHPQL